jgi:hypothetical protein
VNADSLAKVDPSPGDRSAFDPEKLKDILFYVEYRVRGDE